MTSPRFLGSSVSKRLAAVAGAALLSFSLVACGEESTDPAIESPSADSTASSGEIPPPSEGVPPAANIPPAEGASPAAPVEEADAMLADGQTVRLPAPLAAAIAESGRQATTVVATTGQRAVVGMDNGDHLVFTPEYGVAPVIGEINRVWFMQVDSPEAILDNPVGMPVSPEENLGETLGWRQAFEHGVITWAPTEAGGWKSTVELYPVAPPAPAPAPEGALVPAPAPAPGPAPAPEGAPAPAQ